MTETIENQLVTAQEELAALKAEYEEFTYIISHDLNAPLRQIEGFSEIIFSKYNDRFDDKTQKHFELIRGGTVKARDILEALTHYSRINTRAQPFVLLNINDIVNDVKTSLSSLISCSGAQITFNGLPSILGDKAQIELLFYHLIHNAIFYQLPDTKPEIIIEATENSKVWQFCITDNGIGILDKHIDQIFKPLRRGVHEKKYTGMGMGLAFARRILSKHQGKIWLEKSDNDSGSSFHFTMEK